MESLDGLGKRGSHNRSLLSSLCGGIISFAGSAWIAVMAGSLYLLLAQKWQVHKYYGFMIDTSPLSRLKRHE